MLQLKTFVNKASRANFCGMELDYFFLESAVFPYLYCETEIEGMAGD